MKSISNVSRGAGLVVIFALIVMVAVPAWGQSAGEALYKSKCQACHGPDGSGDTVMGKKLGAKDLRSAEIQKQTDSQMSEIITKGKEKMKGFEGRLTADEVKTLVAQVRALKK
jgi:mono/diheme cytochrome c family protein